MMSKLFYNNPAAEWNEALPLGNGRLGAMCFGGVIQEELQLNEDSIWAGPPVPENRRGGSPFIDEARQLLFRGKYAEAQKLIQNKVMAERIAPRSYQTLGSLFISLEGMEHFEDYRRELDLGRAIAETSWSSRKHEYRREVFISPVTQTISCRTECLTGGHLNGTLWFARESGAEISCGEEGVILISGQAEHGGRHKGVRFFSMVAVTSGTGSIRNEQDCITVRNASSFTVHITCYTDYNFKNPENPLQADLKRLCGETIDSVRKLDPVKVRKDHIAAHTGLFDRMSLSLAGDSDASAEIPTDQLLREFPEKPSPALVELYFSFARYLLICSSRPGTLCANLQGIWNRDIEAIWNSDYHININIQMIYWLAEAAGLPECHTPFFELMESLVEPGKVTAAEVYGCRGTVAHHTTDVWHFTAPLGHVQYGMWPMGAGWSSRHFMEHYEYSGDRDFLRNRALPYLEEVVRFYLDFLVEDPATGLLVSGPTSSPENMFFTPDADREAISVLVMSDVAHERFYTPETGVCNLTMGCSMDQQIIRETFSHYLRCIEELNCSGKLEKDVHQALLKLKDPEIGSDGRLMEWQHELEEVDPGHRHISHVYGLFPGTQYSGNREMLKAAEKSIRGRIDSGSGHTGWSRAWMINLFARLKNRDEAWNNLKELIGQSTLPNLFDTHPPFQMDGNMGGASGLLEMLVQSHNGSIELFPAWPDELPEGSVRGLRVRNGFTIALSWKENELTGLKIESAKGEKPEVFCKGTSIPLRRSEKEKRTFFTYGPSVLY